MYELGQLVKYNGDYLYYRIPAPPEYIISKKLFSTAEIRINDERKLSPTQRAAIYATLNDISNHTGYMPEEAKQIMKYYFISRYGGDYFSLSGCDMTLARNFLEFLIEFCLEHDISTQDSLLERSPDIARYIYACSMNKKCCITGKNAQLHHVDAVGMGRDRKDIIHKGMRVMPLHWKLHAEVHNTGKKQFEEKYHVFGIRVDDDICRVWKLKG